MKLTVVFDDHRIETEYANGYISNVDFYTNHGEVFFGNTVMRDAFTSAVSSVGHNMNDYWAIQYYGGKQEIEYANGHPNQVISSNTGLSAYTSLVDTWSEVLKEEERIASIPSWDSIRKTRGGYLTQSDKIVAWSVETGNAIPQDWTDYRQELRDITITYNAPTGNTELVVFPEEPSWPTS